MKHFWIGFEKTAFRIGAKAVKPLSATGKMVGNKPASGVTTAAAFKPNPLPTPKHFSATKNTAPATPKNPLKPPSPQPSQRIPGGSATAI